MNNAEDAARHEIYSRRYFDASQTWFAWNKLTAADVYALREEADFPGQNVYFWLNHPIQFVRIVGLVVQIDLVGNGRYTLITLDDSSGANIEIKIERRIEPSTDHAMYPSNTGVDNVDVFVELGLPILQVDKIPVGIGTILKANGCLISWRQERQLDLKRIWRVCDTNEEAEHWFKAAEWKKTVLNKPWVLEKEQRDAIDNQIHQEQQLDRKRAANYKERKAKYEERRKQKELQREQKRKDMEAKLNAGALKGSEFLPQPWL